MSLDLRLVAHPADREAEELTAERGRNRLADRGLADARRSDQADDRTAPGAVAAAGDEPADGEILENPLLDVVEAVVIAVQSALRTGQIHEFVLGFVPGQGGDRLQIVPRDYEFSRARIHQREFLHLVVDPLACLAAHLELLEDLHEALMFARLGIDRHAELRLDRFQLFLEKVFALTLLDLLVELFLDALLDAQQLLFFLDEYEHPFHALTNVQGLQHGLLFGSLDVQNGSHEIGDLSGVVDVYHVEPHLFREQRIVFRYLLHLGDQRARQGAYFERLHVGAVEVLDGGRQRRFGGKHLGDPKALQR